MNHKKLILFATLSGLVTLSTYVLGVAGSVIGSVFGSVLYTVLSEALEDPVSNASFNRDFEWDIVYVIPLVIIALIQLLLIFALLAEMGILPYTFLNAFLSLQHFADNNLYRILGFSLLVISAYPLVLKPDFVKQGHGLILAFVGVIFLARGFVDLSNSITAIYDAVFIYFDLPVAIITFLLIVYVIYRILVLSSESQKEYELTHPKKDTSVSHHYSGSNTRIRRPRKVKRFRNNAQNPKNQKMSSGINESSSQIHFESNDLLDDYKK